MATRMASRVWKRGCQRLKSSPKCRSFCSSTPGADITSVPLSKPLPNMPLPQYASVGGSSADTQVTVLNNGLSVASQNKFGQFCTVGVVLDSGSRYEVAYPSGVSHFLEKLAFCSTTEYENRDHILQELEKHGGICDCQGSRDTLIYAASAETTGLPAVMNILSEVVLRPNITDNELEDSRVAISFELENLNMQPDPEPLLMELIHAAAFRDNTVGLPRFCPTENIAVHTRSSLYTYLKNFHSPRRMVVAGVGMDHQHLVQLTQEYFVNRKSPIWTEHVGIIDTNKADDKSVAQYTGGNLQVEKDLSDVSLGPTPFPELAHVVIGLESCSHQDPDFVAFCVLNMMMGGGGSFSAGGPGKGMYTRLYLNVLNRYHWMYNATAFNHAYQDTGLFCIHASSHPSQLTELVEVIVREVVNTASKVFPDELDRAKRQVQSMLLMNLESRPVVFEDIGRQVLANGHRKPAKYFYEEINKITEEDIRRVATRMLRSRPAVAAYGSLSQMPSYGNIETALASKDGRMPRKFSLFRSS
ncbi:mitochondrial-processing peptidase subunit alpha-like isoform X1 [Haliotis cracherodii]|uniref:mitochondrial-processing peptidase subunit alpha-like isoform X1 n=1 Tax=Haliotis cracherodii TaxID=6455 RepID=UPI0039E96B80